MSRWRILLVALLVASPVLLFAGAGSYFLWQTGWGLVVWFIMAGCMMTGYFLGLYWLRKKRLLHPIDFTPPEVASERDRQAWEIVGRIASEVAQEAKKDGSRLTTIDHYVQTSLELVRALAKHYHPAEEDPVGGLTVPEMLAVVELATRDLGELVDQYLPGGHLLTIRDMRRARRVADWYESASKVYWALSALFSPVTTGVRYAATKIGLSMPLQALQQDFVLWFHAAFLQRLGFYLIELYSGRLRVGTERWRELVRNEGEKKEAITTLALMGRVKAGKSSLVNALLGENKAEVDVLPATESVRRYQVAPEDVDARLILLDTPGFGDDGPKASQLVAVEEAAQQADLLLLVVHARDPGRQADLRMLTELRQWYAQHPDLKPPPILAVLTHVDLLSPAMEWSPPYDWQDGQRPKEKSVRAAAETVQSQFGELVDAVLPVCTAAGKVFGIEEYLLPALAARLDEARVVSVLRCLRRDYDQGKVQKVFGQLLQAGKGVMNILWGKKPAS